MTPNVGDKRPPKAVRLTDLLGHAQRAPHLIARDSCSLAPSRLLGKSTFDELPGLFLRNDFIRPHKVTVQKRRALAIGNLAIDLEERARWIRLSHCNGALDVKAWRDTLPRERTSSNLFA